MSEGEEVKPVPTVLDPLVADAIAVAQQKVSTSQQNADVVGERIEHAGTDPSYVTAPEPPPETMTHQQIWDAVQQIDREAMWNLVSAWGRISTTVISAFQWNQIHVQRALQGRWEGAGADAAHEAVRRFTQAGGDVGEVAQSVGFRLDAMYYAASALAASVPPPPVATSADPDNPDESVLPGITSGEKDRSDSEAAIAARNQAVAAVKNIYLPVFPPAGDGVPVFVAPPATGDQSAGVTTGPIVPGSDPGSTIRPDTDKWQPSSTGPGSTNAAVTEAASAIAPTAEKQPTTTAGAAGTGANPGNANQSTMSASAGGGPVSGRSGSSASSGRDNRPHGSTNPDRGSATGGPGNPGGRGVTGMPTTPGRPGVSQPGGPGGAVPGVGTGAGSSPRGASNGRGAMGPMAPGASARRGEDNENTRSIPDYLIRQQDEFTELPPVPPGVIDGGGINTTVASDYEPLEDRSSRAVESSHSPTSAPYFHDNFDRPADGQQRPVVTPAGSSQPVPSVSARGARPARPVSEQSAANTAEDISARNAPRDDIVDGDQSTMANGPEPSANTTERAVEESGQPAEEKPKTVSFTLQGPVMDDYPPTQTGGTADR